MVVEWTIWKRSIKAGAVAMLHVSDGSQFFFILFFLRFYFIHS